MILFRCFICWSIFTFGNASDRIFLFMDISDSSYGWRVILILIYFHLCLFCSKNFLEFMTFLTNFLRI